MRVIFRSSFLLLLVVFLFAQDSPKEIYPLNRQFKLRERYETLMYFHSTCAISGEGVDEGKIVEVDLKIPIAFGGDTSFFNRWVLTTDYAKIKNDFFTNFSTNEWRYIFGGKYATTRFYRYAQVSQGKETPAWMLEIVARDSWRQWMNGMLTLKNKGLIEYTYTRTGNIYYVTLISNDASYEFPTNEYDIPEYKEVFFIAKNRRADNERTPFTSAFREHIRKKYNYTCQRCGRHYGDAISDTRFTTIEVDHIIPVSWGGGNEEENVWALCKYCNIGKSDYYEDGPDPKVEIVLNMKEADDRLLAYCTYKEGELVDPYILRIVYNYSHRDWQRALLHLKENGLLKYEYDRKTKMYKIKWVKNAH